MAVTIQRYRPPRQPVSIIDNGGQQITFDYPEDMLRWFQENPDQAERIGKFAWLVSGRNG